MSSLRASVDHWEDESLSGHSPGHSHSSRNGYLQDIPASPSASAMSSPSSSSLLNVSNPLPGGRRGSIRLSRRQTTSAHEGAQLAFDVIKVNKAGARQSRRLKMSRAGISNEKGSSTQWFHPSEDVFEISQDEENPNSFSISVLTSYVFELKTAKEVERIIQSFEKLGMGKVIKRASSAYMIDSQGRTTQLARDTQISLASYSQQQTSLDSSSEMESAAAADETHEDCEFVVPNLIWFQYASSEIRFFPLCRVEFGNMIGRGSFGKVIVCREKQNSEKWYALKLLHKSTVRQQKQMENVQRERVVLAKLAHPLIVRLEGTAQTKNFLAMVLEYVPGGDLVRFIKASTVGFPLPESVARLLIAEIIAAVGHLHANGVIYRDLKPENILIDQTGHIRLTDFGLAKENMNPGTSTKTFCGTPDFQAPEVIRGDYYDVSVDWWSVGCILYELLFRSSPFYAVSRHMVYSKIIDAQYSFPIDEKLSVSAEAKDLISQFLRKDPKDRLSNYNQIQSHKFFEGINWLDVEAGRLEMLFWPRPGKQCFSDLGEPAESSLIAELRDDNNGIYGPNDTFVEGF
eukprot:ANDGO_00170.mRNA.1 RAC serine/threonine-protein kinase